MYTYLLIITYRMSNIFYERYDNDIIIVVLKKNEEFSSELLEIHSL